MLKYMSLHQSLVGSLFILLMTPSHTVLGMDNNNNDLGSKLLNTIKWCNAFYLTARAVEYTYNNTGWTQKSLDRSLYNKLNPEFKVGYDLKFLIEKKANPNARYEYNNTVLHNAIFNEEIPNISFLIEHGADYSLQNDWGNTIFHMCFMNIMQVINIFQSESDIKRHSAHGIKMYENLCSITTKKRTSQENEKVMVFLLILKRMQKEKGVTVPNVLRKYIFTNFVEIPYANQEVSIAKKSILQLRNKMGLTPLDLYEKAKENLNNNSN